MDDSSSNTRWKSLQQLRDPFNDAVNYRSRQEKEFFSQIFLRTHDLYDCLKPSVYYLIGEKGSGKTAYAAYLESNDVDGHRCKLSTMTETQYKRFIALKRQGKLDYSDYANIWRPILLTMVAQALIEKSKGLIDGFTGKFDAIEEEIESFNSQTLNPEVEVAFEMVTGTNDKIAFGNEKYIKYETDDSASSSDKSQIIKHHLLEKESRLKEAVADLKLRKNHILFVDGIDYRPEDVPYADYLACIKGLGEASWQLNADYFSNIRDSKGRIKIVLLVRPDVFHSLNLYNSNSRLRDNSVLLDWSTNEKDLKQSKLYEAADRYFSIQQDFEADTAAAADHYLSANSSNEIFRQFLRKSFQKPRDLLTLIRLTKDISVKRLRRGHENKIGADVIRDPSFTKEYADYMLGEVRNYAAFYMTPSDFNKYMKFFQYLDGKLEFNFSDFSTAFAKFKNWINGEQLTAVDYVRDAEALIQLFYDVNIVGYREEVGSEGERHYHFAFRERTLTNVAPQIKITANLIINPGLAKALDIGLRAKQLIGTDSRLPEKKRNSHRPAINMQNEDKGKKVSIGTNETPSSPSPKKRRRRRKPKAPS